MEESRQFVVFALDGQRCALPLGVVQRLVRMVEITDLPECPPSVLGIVNYQGRILPVVDPRRRFGLAAREIEPDDWLIIAATPERGLALVIGPDCELREISRCDLIEGSVILPGLALTAQVAATPDGLIIIEDLRALLPPEATAPAPDSEGLRP